MLRDFSSILTYSLNAEAMLKQFLSFLREILSVNRAAIFLNRPCGPLTETISPKTAAACAPPPPSASRPACSNILNSRWIRASAARSSGSAGFCAATATKPAPTPKRKRNLNCSARRSPCPWPTATASSAWRCFDGRVTGEPLGNVELELIFHLLEQVGLALRNIWLHDQLAGNNEMMTDVLRELSSACIVVGRDLKVLHANKAARRHFGRKNQRTGELEFSDLPQMLGAKIYQVLKTGAALEPFRYEPDNSPGTVYNISVVPFQRGNSTVPISALLTADDLTQSEQLRGLEVEAANLRLVKTMADRLAHEIGNALVPLSTHQQLLAEKFKDKEFRESLDHALADGVKRVSRLISQMRFLAREGHIEQEAFAVEKLIEDAYQEARKHQSVDTAQLNYENGGKPVIITGDRAALKHALSEIMLNALQANPKAPTVDVRMHTEPGSEGGQDLQIEVQDSGSGFTSETAQKVPSPFFTTRNVGLGLGLTVSRKIIETHHGKLEIVPPQSGQSGVVRVSLPLDPVHTTAA
jgi:signal transduction histidine kinase